MRVFSMSAFCGLWHSRRDNFLSLENLKAMSQKFEERGGDISFNYGMYAVLASQQLSLYERANKKIIVEGSIFNLNDIKKLLPRDREYGHESAPILFELIELYGLEKTLQQLNGQFALVVMDAKQIFLARDHFGLKNLYYSVENSGLIFSNRLAAVVAHPEFKRQINQQALSGFFKFNYVPSELCIYENVHKVPAGSYVVYNGDSITIHKYYSPLKIALESEILDASDNELISGFADVLQNAVNIRINNEVNSSGLFLSGGIDSSLIAACLNGRKDFTAITVGFEEENFCEIDDAKFITSELGIKHFCHKMGASDAVSLVHEIADIYEEPFADQSLMSSLLAFKIADKLTSEVWLGDGSDEIFTGYTRQLQHAKYAVERDPVTGNTLFSNMKNNPRSYIMHMLGSKKGEYVDHLVSNPQYRKIAKCFVEPGPVVAPDIYGIGNPARRATMFDIAIYLPGSVLVKNTQIAKKFNIDTRLPLLDKDLFAYAQKLPNHLFVDGNTSKVVLRKLLQKFLPEKVLQRPKKGFSPPVGHWLKTELNGWMEELLQPAELKKHDLLNLAMVRYYKKTLPYKGSSTNRLWAIIMLQLWLKANKFC